MVHVVLWDHEQEVLSTTLITMEIVLLVDQLVYVLQEWQVDLCMIVYYILDLGYVKVNSVELIQVVQLQNYIVEIQHLEQMNQVNSVMSD